jgi:limonene-1,2-epoxide hydrolase
MNTSRRSLLVASGAGLLAAAAVGTRAHAKTMTSTEKANIKLLKEFLAEFSSPDVDLEVVMQKYIAPTGSVRWADNLPAVIGPIAASAQARQLMPKGASATFKYLDIFARGPVVATSRIDTIIIPGKAKTLYPIAGVHVIKDGRLVEYTDYILS